VDRVGGQVQCEILRVVQRSAHRGNRIRAFEGSGIRQPGGECVRRDGSLLGNAGGVAVEGSTEAWPGSSTQPTLAAFDSLNRQRSYIEVFARGRRKMEFTVSADEPWVVITEEPAPDSQGDRRLWVDIDCNKAPPRQSAGTITISGTGGQVAVKFTATKATPEQLRQS